METFSCKGYGGTPAIGISPCLMQHGTYSGTYPGLSRATSECKGKECSSRKGMCLSSHHMRARPVPGSAGFLHQHGLFISNHWEGMCAESCQDGKAHVPILIAAERKMTAEGKQQQKEKLDSDGLRGQWQAILVHVSGISDKVLLCCPGWSAVAQSWESTENVEGLPADLFVKGTEDVNKITNNVGRTQDISKCVPPSATFHDEHFEMSQYYT
ncbi:hypothetical protein H8957_010708 [Semnopithecus entellus]